jgi:hypothetical protein
MKPKKVVCIFVMTLLILSIIPIVNSEEQKLCIISPGVVDQEQPNINEIDWLEGGVDNWQQFRNRGRVLEEVELHIGCWYSGSYPITLSIKETLTSPALTDITYPAAAFPLDVQDWFTFNVPDVNLSLFKTYYIVLNFDPGSEYGWTGDYGDPYPQGGSSHTASDWDYAFRTIVDKSKPKNNLEILSPGVVDQQQLDTSEVDFLENGVPHWQQFINRGKTIEEVHVHIGHYYSGSEPMTLSIQKPIGNKLCFKTLTTADIPDHAQDWCIFDLPDTPLVQGDLYYIVIEFDMGSEYEWSGVHGDPYPDGASSHPDADWDYAFKTIVDRSRPRFINIFESFPLINQFIQKLINNFLS